MSLAMNHVVTATHRISPSSSVGNYTRRIPRQFKQVNREQRLVKQIEVPICQYFIPLPSTPRRDDRQQLLLFTARSTGGSSIARELNRDINRSSVQTLNVTLLCKKESQLFLKGRAMTSPGSRGNQPLSPQNGHMSPRRHGRRGASPAVERSAERAPEPASSTPRETKTAMSARRSDTSKAIQLPSITYGSETKPSHVDYMFNSSRYLDSYGTSDHGQEGKDISDLDLATLRLKRKRTTQRKDNPSPRPDTNGRQLNQCLVINPTKSSSPTLSPEEDIKLKNHTTFVPKFSKRETKMVHSGLYASVPNNPSSSDVSTSSTGSYKFTSIDSYLKFNDYIRQESSPVKTPTRVPVSKDINASVTGRHSEGTTARRPDRRLRSKHRGDTTSRTTSARDSDVAALRDLEEFFVVTTPHMEEKSTKSLKSGKSNKTSATDVSSNKGK